MVILVTRGGCGKLLLPTKTMCRIGQSTHLVIFFSKFENEKIESKIVKNRRIN